MSDEIEELNRQLAQALARAEKAEATLVDGHASLDQCDIPRTMPDSNGVGVIPMTLRGRIKTLLMERDAALARERAERERAKKAEAACADWAQWFDSIALEGTYFFDHMSDPCPFCGQPWLKHAPNCPWPVVQELYDADNPGQPLLDELARLRGIVRKLSVTADGVPVVPWMRVWCWDADGNLQEIIIGDATPMYEGEGDPQGEPWDEKAWYMGDAHGTFSTREAAEKAKDPRP